MKSNLISSLLALVIGAIVGSYLINNHLSSVDSNRIQHLITIAILVIVSFMLYGKNQEVKKLKAELERLKS
jgi:uncharacterized membrane protein YfcA